MSKAVRGMKLPVNVVLDRPLEDGEVWEGEEISNLRQNKWVAHIEHTNVRLLVCTDGIGGPDYQPLIKEELE